MYAGYFYGVRVSNKYFSIGHSQNDGQYNKIIEAILPTAVRYLLVKKPQILASIDVLIYFDYTVANCIL